MKETILGLALLSTRSNMWGLAEFYNFSLYRGLSRSNVTPTNVGGPFTAQSPGRST